MTHLEQEFPSARELFPADCHWSKALPDTCDAPFPQETALRLNAALGVRQLFAAGRRAAHEALQQLIIAELAEQKTAAKPSPKTSNLPILKYPTGAPLWPTHVVGSITHTVGIALAVVGPSHQYAGLGFDVEKITRCPHLSLTTKVCAAEERDWIEAPLSETEPRAQAEDLRSRASFRLLRLLSAKEAVYKTFFPISQIYLGFTEAQLWPETWGFRGRLLKKMGEHAPEGLAFRVLQSVEDGYLLSACHHLQSC